MDLGTILICASNAAAFFIPVCVLGGSSEDFRNERVDEKAASSFFDRVSGEDAFGMGKEGKPKTVIVTEEDMLNLEHDLRDIYNEAKRDFDREGEFPYPMPAEGEFNSENGYRWT